MASAGRSFEDPISSVRQGYSQAQTAPLCNVDHNVICAGVGFLFTYATNFGNGSGSRSMIYGTEGVMDFTRRPVVSGSGSFGKSKINEMSLEPVDGPDHFLNWLECLPSRKQPFAPIKAGYQHSIACIVADRAMQTGQRQVYRRETGEICAG